MKHLARVAVLVVLAAAASPSRAQEKPPAEPPPKMEPDKIGPRTDAANEKAYANVVRVGGGESIADDSNSTSQA